MHGGATLITKEFIEYITEKTGILKTELIEKDLILQEILKELSKEEYFTKNFIFKGGTCIIKCYLSYYRFSEDLDFSWSNQTVYYQMSEKKIRTILAKEINTVMEVLAKIAAKHSLKFLKDKTDKKYVEFGGSNKFVTYKLWYTSVILNREQFIKIQINFVEHFMYVSKRCVAKTMIKGIPAKELEFLFPKEAAIVLEGVKINAYDLREILIEKVRALLTRRGVKARDFIDVYFITKHLQESITKYKKEIITKTKFMLKYEKYKTNLLEKKDIIGSFRWINEENITLQQPGKDFDKFIEEIKVFLLEITEEIVGDKKT